jgi:hypothetical protein
LRLFQRNSRHGPDKRPDTIGTKRRNLPARQLFLNVNIEWRRCRKSGWIRRHAPRQTPNRLARCTPAGLADAPAQPKLCPLRVNFARQQHHSAADGDRPLH